MLHSPYNLLVVKLLNKSKVPTDNAEISLKYWIELENFYKFNGLKPPRSGLVQCWIWQVYCYVKILLKILMIWRIFS